LSNPKLFPPTLYFVAYLLIYLIHIYNIYKNNIFYLQIFTSKINNNIALYIICKYSKFNE
jgi:hypothetical protein